MMGPKVRSEPNKQQDSGTMTLGVRSIEVRTYSVRKEKFCKNLVSPFERIDFPETIQLRIVIMMCSVLRYIALPL